METTTFNQSILRNYTDSVSRPSVWSSFIRWCDGQQENRLLWIGLALGIHGCVFAPLTVMLVALAGNSLGLFMTAMASMAMALVVNLAAMPTKVTIPIFFATLLIDLGIIVACVSMLMQ